jgi:hypothetical protein
MWFLLLLTLIRASEHRLLVAKATRFDSKALNHTTIRKIRPSSLFPHSVQRLPHAVLPDSLILKPAKKKLNFKAGKKTSYISLSLSRSLSLSL